MFTIKQWRKARDMSQGELAAKMDVTIATIARWEKDASKVTISDCYKLADVLNTSFEEIIFLPQISNSN